jgi:hypothetical protein
MYQVVKSTHLGHSVEVGRFATEEEASAAVWQTIEASLGKVGKDNVYAEADADNPGCSDFFAWSGAMTVVVSINKKEAQQ